MMYAKQEMIKVGASKRLLACRQTSNANVSQCRGETALSTWSKIPRMAVAGKSIPSTSQKQELQQHAQIRKGEHVGSALATVEVGSSTPKSRSYAAERASSIVFAPRIHSSRLQTITTATMATQCNLPPVCHIGVNTQLMTLSDELQGEDALKDDGKNLVALNKHYMLDPEFIIKLAKLVKVNCGVLENAIRNLISEDMIQGDFGRPMSSIIPMVIVSKEQQPPIAPTGQHQMMINQPLMSINFPQMTQPSMTSLMSAHQLPTIVNNTHLARSSNAYESIMHRRTSSPVRETGRYHLETEFERYGCYLSALPGAEVKEEYVDCAMTDAPILISDDFDDIDFVNDQNTTDLRIAAFVYPEPGSIGGFDMSDDADIN